MATYVFLFSDEIQMGKTSMRETVAFSGIDHIDVMIDLQIET